MQENKEIQHTITINKISQANSHKDIEDSIKIFLQTAKKNKRNIKIITPTDFIAERLYKDFNEYMDTCNIETFCFYPIKLEHLFSSDYKSKRKIWQEKLNITYINEYNENPLEVFIDKVAKEANRVRDNKQEEAEKSNFFHEIAIALTNASIQVGSGSATDLYNIDSVKVNQEKIKRYGFFEDIEQLDYTNAYISTNTRNFNDIKDTDSVGIKYIKEFFIDVVERIENYYKAYIIDEYAMRDKLKDIKEKLMNARNEILKNLSNTEQNKKDDETRAALLVALKIGIAIISVCLSLGSGSLFILLALSLGATSAIREICDIAKELHEIDCNRHYRAIAVPILTAFFKDISDVLVICFIESNIFMLLDSEGNFMDLSGIDADFFIQKKSFNLTPDFNQILQGKYHGYIQNIIDILTKKQLFTINNNSEYSYMCISPLNKDSKESPSYTLFNKLAKSYTNLVYIAHKNFTSRILAANINKKNTTTQSIKNYIILTQPPNKEKAGSMEQAVSELNIKIQGRPEPPKLIMQNKTQDYSAYKHDDMDLNNIFLCLSPFVKIDQTKMGEYKDNKALSNDDREYIQKFMLQDENTQSIKALQETFIKEHIKYYEFLFDSIQFQAYSKNDGVVFDGEQYFYTPENIFLKALILYYLEQDGVELKKGIFVEFYAKAGNIEQTLQEKNTHFLVQYSEKQAIPIDLIELKNKIKEAIQAYKEKNYNYEIVLGNFMGNITLYPFSNDINKISFAFIGNSIKEQYIGFSDKNLNEALLLIMQSIGENILTTLLPSTKIFFADTQSKTLEAISILFITFSFALYASKKGNKLTLAMLSAATGMKGFLNLSNSIKNSTLEVIEAALNNKKVSIKISNNTKKNKQISDLLKKINLQELYKNSEIKTEVVENKLIIKKDGNNIKLAIIDNSNKMQPPTHITIQADNIRNNMLKTISNEATKVAYQAIVIALADTLLTSIINSTFTTDSKGLLERYNILESKLQLTCNEALIMDNDRFFTYPMPINSRMIMYNFAYGLFGGSLSSGGLEIAPNILLYAALQRQTSTNRVTNQSEFTRQLIVKQILAFIIPDELRGGMEDRDFYKTILMKELNANTLKLEYRLDISNKRLQGSVNEIIQSYNLDNNQCNKQSITFNPKVNVIVDSYNFCIDYLADMLDNKPKTTHTMQFVESLRNIAKNNILAIYEGIAEHDKVKQPKIFGRIATTIIQKHGFYMG